MKATRIQKQLSFLGTSRGKELFVWTEWLCGGAQVSLTSSRAQGLHGGHGLPFIPLRVVTLTGAQPVGAVIAAHGVEQPVDHSHANTDAPRQHGGNQLPLVLFWVVPAPQEEHGLVITSVVFPTLYCSSKTQGSDSGTVPIYLANMANTQPLWGWAQWCYRAHVPLILQVPQCCAGILAHQSGHENQMKDIIIHTFIVYYECWGSNVTYFYIREQ